VALSTGQKSHKHGKQGKAYIAASPGGGGGGGDGGGGGSQFASGNHEQQQPHYGGSQQGSHQSFAGSQGFNGGKSSSPAAKHTYPLLLADTRTLNTDGTINFNFQADNGLQQGESVDADGTRRGFYSYPGADGKILTVKYSAGKNGFIAEGDHLPMQPQSAAHSSKDEQSYAPKERIGRQDGQYNPSNPSGQYNPSGPSSFGGGPSGGHDSGAYRPSGGGGQFSSGGGRGGGHGGQSSPHFSSPYSLAELEEAVAASVDLMEPTSHKILTMTFQAFQAALQEVVVVADLSPVDQELDASQEEPVVPQVILHSVAQPSEEDPGVVDVEEVVLLTIPVDLHTNQELHRTNLVAAHPLAQVVEEEALLSVVDLHSEHLAQAEDPEVSCILLPTRTFQLEPAQSMPTLTWEIMVTFPSTLLQVAPNSTILREDWEDLMGDLKEVKALQTIPAALQEITKEQDQGQGLAPELKVEDLGDNTKDKLRWNVVSLLQILVMFSIPHQTKVYHDYAAIIT
jgi:hypothetical protein